VIKALLLLLLALLLAAKASAAFDEAYGQVTYVVDGSTLDIAVEKADPRMASAYERVVLAEIKAPEASTQEGAQAKELTSALVMGRRIYLDIDDVASRDSYGRLVGVAYLSGTHGQPIARPCLNRILVDSGYATLVRLTGSEFDPSLWWESAPSSVVQKPFVEWTNSDNTDPERLGRCLLSQAEAGIFREGNKLAVQALDWLRGEITSRTSMPTL
jgi:endonuclease YncB( thermonuclease family)